MEELNSNVRFSDRVDTRDIRALEAVAVVATESEVFSDRLTTVLLRNDMVNLKREPCVSRGKHAVLTPIDCSTPDKFDKRRFHPAGCNF